MRSFILLPACLSAVSGEESSSLIQLKLHRESQVTPDDPKVVCRKAYSRKCKKDQGCKDKVGAAKKMCKGACGLSARLNAYSAAGDCTGYTTAAFNPAELCTKAYENKCKKAQCKDMAKGKEKRACKQSCKADSATSYQAGKCTTFSAPKPAAPKPAAPKPAAPKPAAPKPAKPVDDYKPPVDDVPAYDVPVRTTCGEWSSWGECTKSCGGGSQYRTYTFFADVTHDGLKCEHTCEHGNGDKQSQRCNEDVRCPVDCEGSWSAFDNCTASCGGGVQKRTYTVTREAQHGGKECPAECGTEEVNKCGTEECVTDCEGRFEDWTDCLGTGPDPLCDAFGTKTGSQSRSFTITKQASPGGCKDKCLPDEERSCELPCCPEKCEGSWGEWGKCEDDGYGSLKFMSDGGYGETCCGGGKKTKTFTVTKEKVCGGECCAAADGATMQDDCCTTPCPIDCEGEWGPKSDCSTPCDPGHTERIYKIKVQAQHGGDECPHEHGEIMEEPCNTRDPEDRCPIDCKGKWGPWTDCSQTCKHSPREGHPSPNGTMSRKYIITQEAEFGGIKCSDCGKEEVKKCGPPGLPAVPEPCPVPAVCKWSDWGECSKECADCSIGYGEDYIFRKRKWIEIKPAKHGGKECKNDPPAYEPDEEPCDQPCCPEPCVGSWGPWDYCNAQISVPGGFPCGGGSQTRVYSITKEAKYGGQECCKKDGDEETKTCGDACCEDHCVGAWSEWGSCCVSCSKTETLPGRGGTRSRTFQVSNPASCNGANCSHKDGHVEVEKCNEDIGCDRDCEGSWSAWSDCSQACTDCEGYGSFGKKSRKYTVSVTALFGGKQCPFTNGYVETDDCNKHCCEVPCEGSWSEFSECSASCGNGIKKRKFTVTQPALYGGEPCKHCHNKSHTVECNEGPCAVDCCGKWSAWSHCSKECGGGKKTSWFIQTTPAQNGGKPCEAAAWETRQESCNEEACFKPCVGGFSAWSKCDAACAGGKKSRTYTVEQPMVGTPPMIPGFVAGYGPGPGECRHEDGYVETKDCNVHDCPTGYDCPKDKPCNGR